MTSLAAINGTLGAIGGALAAIGGLKAIVYYVVLLYIWIIVARALLSWFPQRPGTFLFRLYGLLYEVTEPYLGLFRRVLPVTRAGSVGIDWSSLVALIVLFIVLELVTKL